MPKNKSEAASNNSKMTETKKEKPVAKEVESLKEKKDLLEDSGTNSDSDSVSWYLNSDDCDSDISDSKDDDSHGDGSGESLHSLIEELGFRIEDGDDHEGSDDSESEKVDSENGKEEDETDDEEDYEQGKPVEELVEPVEESDSSEDEVPARNTVGDVPLEWYEDEKEKQDKLDSFIANMDDSKNWRKVYDEYNDEEIELTKEESKMISKVLKGKAPHAEFNPNPDYIDWFKW